MRKPGQDNVKKWIDRNEQHTGVPPLRIFVNLTSCQPHGARSPVRPATAAAAASCSAELTAVVRRSQPQC